LTKKRWEEGGGGRREDEGGEGWEGVDVTPTFGWKWVSVELLTSAHQGGRDSSSYQQGTFMEIAGFREVSAIH